MTGRKQPRSRNAPCPCGSGKKYKHCCATKGFTWVEDDEGSTYRNVPLPPELAGILEKLGEDFVSQHGREPEPDDPLFPDLPHAEHVEADLAQTMRAAGLPPEFVYAFEKTGLLVSEANRHLIPDVDLTAWTQAVEEFRAQGGDPWEQPPSVQGDQQIANDEPHPEKEGTATRALPTGADEWLSEIGGAYRDALEAQPLSVLIVGGPLSDDELYKLAPYIFFTVRGGDLSERERNEITDGALANHVAPGDCEGCDGVERSPLLDFAFCYLAAHYVAGLLGEFEVVTIMDVCEGREADLEKRVGEDR